MFNSFNSCSGFLVYWSPGLLEFNAHYIVADAITDDDDLAVFDCFNSVIICINEIDCGNHLCTLNNTCMLDGIRCPRHFYMEVSAHTLNRRSVLREVQFVVRAQEEVLVTCLNFAYDEVTNEVSCGTICCLTFFFFNLNVCEDRINNKFSKSR